MAHRRPFRPLTQSDQHLALRARSISVHVVREAETRYGEQALGPRDIAQLARALIGDAAQETVIAIWLNARHCVIGHSEIARGTVNASRLTPRDVLIPGLLLGAASVAVSHNHPSGDAQPSRADRTVTVALRSACELVGLPMLDHVIVTDTSHYSFAADEPWSR